MMRKESLCPAVHSRDATSSSLDMSMLMAETHVRNAY